MEGKKQASEIESFFIDIEKVFKEHNLDGPEKLECVKRYFPAGLRSLFENEFSYAKVKGKLLEEFVEPFDSILDKIINGINVADLRNLPSDTADILKYKLHSLVKPPYCLDNMIKYQIMGIFPEHLQRHLVSPADIDTLNEFVKKADAFWILSNIAYSEGNVDADTYEWCWQETDYINDLSSKYNTISNATETSELTSMSRDHSSLVNAVATSPDCNNISAPEDSNAEDPMTSSAVDGDNNAIVVSDNETTVSCMPSHQEEGDNKSLSDINSKEINHPQKQSELPDVNSSSCHSSPLVTSIHSHKSNCSVTNTSRKSSLYKLISNSVNHSSRSSITMMTNNCDRLPQIVNNGLQSASNGKQDPNYKYRKKKRLTILHNTLNYFLSIITYYIQYMYILYYIHYFLSRITY